MAELFTAYHDHNLAKIEELVSEGVDPNTENVSGKTLLMVAAMNGRKDVVELLLRLGANTNNQESDFGSTALHYAINANTPDIVKMLLEAGANPNIQNNMGSTPLVVAVMDEIVDIVKMLLEAGANPNIQNNMGRTPLVIAAFHGNVDIVKLLLAQPTLQIPIMRDGRSIIDYARQGRFRPQINRLLLQATYSKPRRALNKIIGSVPVNLAGKVKENFGPFKKANTHIWNSIGDFIGPKMEGGRRRKTRAAKRTRRRTHKRRV